MGVVIVIPAYNEEKTIGRVISDINKVMDNTSYEYDILVVDDGSRDRTAKIAKESGAVVYSHPFNYGLADAFRTGMKRALAMDADIIVHTDADRQYLAKDIPRLIKEVEAGYDLVLGSRFRGRIESMPLVKRIGNIAFSRVVSNITRRKITDAQTGLRAFTKQVAKIKINSNHTYTQEQIIHAVKQKFSVKEIPVYFAKRDGKSRLMKNPFDYAVKAGINILRVYRDYEPLKFFGAVGTSFLSAGLLLGAYLFLLFLTVGFVGRTPSIILSMLLIFIGIQLITFGFLADMNKKEV